MIIDDLTFFNPWWDDGRLPERLRKPIKRSIFPQLVEYLTSPQIISLVGLRRTGKTTLMYQLIEFLLSSGVANENILYFSFDMKMGSIRELIEMYETYSSKNGKKTTAYLFLDEIQKLDDWENQLKIIYDQNNLKKFIISGSSGTTLLKRSKETLAGRLFTLVLQPLSFKEYLHFRGIEIPEYSNMETFHKKLILKKTLYSSELYRFLRVGGLIEGMSLDEKRYDEFIQSVVLDKVIFQDIPEHYSVKEPGVLRELIRIIAERPGMLLNYESLSSDLKRSRQSISNYIHYLENAFILKILYNHSGSFITSAKKARKVYFSHPSFVQPISSKNLDSVLEGMLLENLIVNETGCEFFHRSASGKEIDCIFRIDQSIIPVEVKYRQQISKTDLKVMKRYIEDNNLSKGIVITKDRFSIDDKIIYLPAFLFLLLPEGIQSLRPLRSVPLVG